MGATPMSLIEAIEREITEAVRVERERCMKPLELLQDDLQRSPDPTEWKIANRLADRIAEIRAAQAGENTVLPSPPGSLESDLIESGLTLYCPDCKTYMTPKAAHDYGGKCFCGSDLVDKKAEGGGR